MTTSPAAVVVLAAGAGTRMKSATPKVLHTIAGRSLLEHALVAAAAVEPARIAVVVRHEREQLIAHLAAVAPQALIADQDAVPGTGRAVSCAIGALDAAAVAGAVAAGNVGPEVLDSAKVTGTVLITSGDVPLVDGPLLHGLLAAHQQAGNTATLLTATLDNPTGYGRIVRDGGSVVAIVEEKDATPEQRAITETNAGIYAFEVDALRAALANVGTDNAQGEVYLTDAVREIVAAGGAVGSFIAPAAHLVEGVNDRIQLAAAAKRYNQQICEHWMREGVSIADPETTWIDATATLEADAVVLPSTHIKGQSHIAAGAVIGPDTTLFNVVVGADATVLRSHASDSVIGESATVGPFSYLRPGTSLGKGGKIGAFVETKAAVIGDGSKIPHLSYVGDATIGEGSNIGAATIFANYDGINKHHTTVGDHVRIGSDNTLIAPVTIGDGAYTGAGSTIRRDVPAGALGITASPQQNIEGWVSSRRAGTASAEAAERALRAPADKDTTILNHVTSHSDDTKGQ